MRCTKRPWIRSPKVARTAAVFCWDFVDVRPRSAPAEAYCHYVSYPQRCVARAGAVLRPRPAARVAVRHNAGGNILRRQSRWIATITVEGPLGPQREDYMFWRRQPLQLLSRKAL
jgi:hypothetical protein